MRLTLSLLALVALDPVAAHARSVLSVPHQYANIQSAIDAAAADDVILVEPGVYHERIRFRGRALTLLSRAGPAHTVIDGAGGGTVVTFAAGEGRNAVLDGFAITGGSDSLDAGGVHVESASPTLRNNVIHGNVGGRRGHGISIVDSAGALLHDNEIRDNRSLPGGNGAGGGGGIGVSGRGAVEILRNRIRENQVTRFSSGGGINLVDAGATRIVGNRIEGNRARLAGAGIAIHGSSTARIENNLIVANALTEPGHGGGVHWLIALGPAGPELIGNTIVDNRAAIGAGIHADGDDRLARIVNNLVMAPPGLAAISCGDFSDLQPPVMHHNIAVGAGSVPYGICLQDDEADRNSQRARPPTFVHRSWRLAPGSVGIDAGDNQATLEIVDLDGRPRFVDGDGDGSRTVDIGALEGW
jgi:parallel beta-helix repeat protein